MFPVAHLQPLGNPFEHENEAERDATFSLFELAQLASNGLPSNSVRPPVPPSLPSDGGSAERISFFGFAR